MKSYIENRSRWFVRETALWMQALIGTKLRGRVMLSGDRYVIVFQVGSRAGMPEQTINSLATIYHLLVVEALRRDASATAQSVVLRYRLDQPRSWLEYPVLRANGGLHITLGSKKPTQEEYEFRIAGYYFLTTTAPGVNLDDEPGYYALKLTQAGDEAPLSGVREYHASVIQLIRKKGGMTAMYGDD